MADTDTIRPVSPEAGMDSYSATAVRAYSYDRRDGSICLDLTRCGTLLGEVVLTPSEVERLIALLQTASAA